MNEITGYTMTAQKVRIGNVEIIERDFHPIFINEDVRKNVLTILCNFEIGQMHMVIWIISQSIELIMTEIMIRIIVGGQPEKSKLITDQIAGESRYILLIIRCGVGNFFFT